MPKQKKELVLYASEYEEYEATLPGKKPGEMAGDSSKDKTRGALADFMKILNEHGRTWPNESDHSEYLSGKPDNSTTSQNETRIRNFFAWLNKRRENKPMAENELQQAGEYVQQELFTENESESVQADDGASTEIISTNEPESLPESEHAEPKKRGRPMRDTENGEKLQKFATVYLTPTQAERFTALCKMDNVKVSARIMELIESEINSNMDLISDFFSLEAKRKIRRKIQ